MTHGLQSYTPTVHPLYYDALTARQGCDGENGIDVLGSLHFAESCIFAHDASNFRFTNPRNVSYQVGPNTTGQPNPQLVTWTAWIDANGNPGQIGVRIAQVGVVIPPVSPMPANSLSGLFPALPAGTASVTHAFSALGLLHLAVESVPPGFIHLRFYTSVSALVAPSDLSFAGVYPLLVNLANVDPSGGAGVVCYYLKPEIPFTLFARFSQDAFATRYTVSPALRVNLTKLTSIRSVGNLVKLYAVDELGRDVTLTSDGYALNINEPSLVGVGLASGFIGAVTVLAAPDEDMSRLGIGLDTIAGRMIDATAETSVISEDQSVLGVVVEAGEMQQIT